MRIRAHVAVAKAKVRDGELSRYDGVRLEGGKVFLVVAGLGLPRTWHLSLGALVEGFQQGLEAAFSEAGKRRPAAPQLVAAAVYARQELANRCDRLVERTLPDAGFAALGFADDELHVVSAGPCRVYLHRSGKPQRLTPRDEAEEGALRARMTQCSTAVEPGDLVMAGSVTAFSVRSIAQAVTVLQDDPRAEPPVLASLLVEPAGRAGVGAVAVVARVF